MKTHFAHKHDKDTPRGGVTVAFEINQDGMVDAFALAKCGPSDNFCRRTGRIKAQGRLNSMRYRKEIYPVSKTEFLNNFYTQN
jgi:hypothetical protein